MAIPERLRNALMATRRLDLHDKVVVKVLKELLKVFEGSWEMVEAENYRALVDAYFESKQNEGPEKEETDDTQGEVSLRPAKRFHSQVAEDRASSVMYKSCELQAENENENGGALTTLQQEVNKKDSSSSGGSTTSKKLLQSPRSRDQKKLFHFISDITKSTEKVKISLQDEVGNEDLPKFNYMVENVIYEKAYVNISLARIADEHCCSGCSGDCLAMPLPCHCAHETGGEFAYTPQGLLKEKFLEAFISAMKEIHEDQYVYCQDCPLERSKYGPGKCNGHLIRRFIKECWRKCGCNILCGNRVVQRGITCKLQVFLSSDGKGWGLRALTDLPKGTFVCEYAGEILTNTELYERNMQSSGSKRHTYPVTLDADWGSERVLKDEEALCLDATFYGNVARFINHRCFDANLVDIPVEIETPDRHYYHLALFTKRDVRALEELTWDYGIDFNDHKHPIKAFRCHCGSACCRDMKQRKGKKVMNHIEIQD